MAQKLLVLGAYGFIGSHLCKSLCARGTEVLAPTRRSAPVPQLDQLPGLERIAADVHDSAQLDALVARSTQVVNLVGILHSAPGRPYGRDFARNHVELPRKIVEACERAGGRRLIHLSALGAAHDAPSGYQRSKADGEAAIRAANPGTAWTLLRPSVVFGPDDHFLNLFAELARWAPVLPLAGAGTRFQPVYVGDVCRAIVHALDDDSAIGACLELAGPRVYTLVELVRHAAARKHRRPWIIPLPLPLAWLQALILEQLPGPLMSRDNLRSLQRDNVASGEALPFGLIPTSLESLFPAGLAPRHG